MFKEQVIGTAGGYIAHEENPQISRDEVFINFPVDTEFLNPGTVLGLITGTEVPGEVNVAAVVTAGDENVGDGTLAVTAFADDAGPLTVTFTTALLFDVTDEDGTKIGDGSVADNAEAFGGITINLTAGATAFAAGDTFSVEIPRQDRGDYVWPRGTYAPLDLAANNGLQNAVAILFAPVFADENGKAVVTARDTTVKLTSLIWPDGITHSQRNAAIQSLALKGIIHRATTIPVY